MHSLFDAALMIQGGERDPYFEDVVLLMHFDGSHGDTAFSDVKGHAVTRVDGASDSTIISTTQSKFGGSSYYSDGATAGYLEISGSDLNIANYDFTAECWVYPTSISGTRPIFVEEVGSVPFNMWESNAGHGWPWLDITGGSIQGSSDPFTINAWQHVAFTRNGSSCRAFLNGVLVGSATLARFADSSSLTLRIGGATSNLFAGYIDELRITKGVARYTATFTPPSSAFPNA